MEGGFTLKIGGFHRTMYKEYIMIPEYDQAYSQMVSFFWDLSKNIGQLNDIQTNLCKHQFCNLVLRYIINRNHNLLQSSA